jgi:hypothetical protein
VVVLQLSDVDKMELEVVVLENNVLQAALLDVAGFPDYCNYMLDWGFLYLL